MTNKPKARGTAGETAVVKYLRDNGFPDAERRALAGNKDVGDVQVCPGVILEVKTYRQFTFEDIDTWLGETLTEKQNSRADHAFLVVKRFNVPIARSLVWHWRVVPSAPWRGLIYLDQFPDFLRSFGYGMPLTT